MNYNQVPEIFSIFAQIFMSNIRYASLFLLLLGGIILFFIFMYGRLLFFKDNTKETVQLIVHARLEALGDLKLAQAHVTVDSVLPSGTRLFLLTGEVCGCLEMKKLRLQDVKITPSSVTIKLPKPTLCSVTLLKKRCKESIVLSRRFPGTSRLK